MKRSCSICGRAISPNNLERHEGACLKPKVKKVYAKKDRVYSNHKRSNQYVKARLLGLPDPKVSDETRRKISTSNTGKRHSLETKKKIAIAMQRAVLNNPDAYSANNICGRVKSHYHKNEKFHGKWEVEFAMWLDDNNIQWIRKTPPFSYYWNEGWHKYFPDFYLPEYDFYVEVKGYEVERDRCKWKAVSNLLIIKAKEIKLIRNNEYSIPLKL